MIKLKSLLLNESASHRAMRDSEKGASKQFLRDFDKAFKDCDFILTPTTPSQAFQIGEKEEDPIKMYLNDIFTVPASLAGIPGISVPFGKSKEHLPLGIQLLSKHFDEQTILNAGFYLEKNNE